MRKRFALVASVVLLATGIGLVAAAAWSAERWIAADQRTAADQRPAASAPAKLAAISMVVYKSAT